MDGHCHNKKEQIIQILKVWINKMITEKLWEKYVDIHIDEINNEFEEKSTWIEGSLFLFSCILELINKSTYDVFLVIPLTCTNISYKNDIMDINCIVNELDITPPAFYLFPKNSKNFEDTIESAKYLKEISEKLNMQVFYKEEKEVEEYYRTLYIRSM